MNLFQIIFPSDNQTPFIKKELNSLPNTDSIKTIYSIMERNYFRLKERYTHDSGKLAVITKDWNKYLEILHLFLNKNYNEDGRKKLNIVLEEIENRFKNLLNKDYENPPPSSTGSP